MLAPQLARPRVVVSKCLEFAPCRYNGVMISDELVRRLKNHVDFVPVCPEMEVGLGCPREVIRVVLAGKQPRLIQPATGRDVTQAMQQFAESFLAGVGEVDAFFLKSRSPSCGIKDVKVFAGAEHKTPQQLGRGFFGGAAIDRFPDLPVEDEGRLSNFSLREHFLTRLFTLAEFRRICRAAEMKDLVEFQASNKWLLMACHQSEMRLMGRIVANTVNRPPAEVFADYGSHLARALARPPRFTSIINVLMHALGYVSDNLSADEKAFFLDTLQKYRDGKVPLSAATTLIKAWGIRFNVGYLLEQTFLAPYPESLVSISDSGKGRDG
jgi:uncharacterized protein YbgA (DUF1722 family)/uncharacterized protein YbbK (DUF523 family)